MVQEQKTTTHGKICVALLNIKPPRHQSVLRRLPFVQCRHLGLPRAVKARLPRAVKAIALRPRAKKQRHHQKDLILIIIFSYSQIIYILTEKVDRGSSRGAPSSSKEAPSSSKEAPVSSKGPQVVQKRFNPRSRDARRLPRPRSTEGAAQSGRAPSNG